MNENDQIEDPDFDRILEAQDFFPKIFLQPTEISLEREQGIKVIKRFPNQPDKFEKQDVKPIIMDQREINRFAVNPERQGEQAEHPAGHGLLSLFKKAGDRRIKLAICICVYSESKHMLKTTIKGIQQSNRDFLEKAGIMSHEIIVVVIFDGIEHLNSSKDQTENMVSLFSEIDIKNGFRLRSNSMSLDDFLRDVQQNKIDPSSLPEDKLNQINLFTEEELRHLQPKLFQNQYRHYMQTKKLLSDVQRLKADKQLRLETLPFEVVKKYEELCVNFCAENNYWFETQEEIQEYLSGSRKNVRFRLIYQALCEVQSLCSQYIKSREETSIVYPVRLEKDYLKNPRQAQNIEDQFSSLMDDSEKKQYNYLFLVVKHRNEGKLGSHMLFLQGFCKLFDPDFFMLTDVGVKPQGDAIFRMYKHMQMTPKCGGVCGYMSLKMENPSDDLGYRLDGYEEDNVDCLTRGLNYVVSIQRAQQFEYHYAHMLDKPFESCFNYIHVLPGAFSGYRWKALKSIKYKDHRDHTSHHNPGSLQIETERNTNSQSSEQVQQPKTLLKDYLKTALSDSVLSLEDSNMYLAEDRILCLGIHLLGYDLHYLPDVESYVDPVTSLTKLLGQRRRWINGSWFAFNYVRNQGNDSNSFFFFLQLFYYSFVQKLQWIAPTLFYVAMNLTLISFVTNNVVPAMQNFFRINQDFQLANYNVLYIFNLQQVLLSIPDVINFVYILTIFSVILWSCLVNNNNSRFKRIYYGASTLLGIYGVLVLALLVYNTYSIIQKTSQEDLSQTGQFLIPLIYLRALILFVIGGFALPVIWTCSFRKSVEMLTSLLSYIYYSPTYINILQVFAFCRINDLSWGTKGLDTDTSATNKMERQWEDRKFKFVLQYLTTNTLFSYFLVRLSKYDMTRNIIILASSALVVFLLAFRLFFALIYIIRYYLQRSCKKFKVETINENRSHGYKVYNALKLIELRIKEVQKERTKRKKYEEFKSMASATSVLLSRALSSFGKKIRNKVANHIVHNNLLPRKDLLDPFKKRIKTKRKASKKPSNIAPIEQVEQRSDSHEQKTPKVKQDSKELPPVKESKEGEKKEIKHILQSIRDRYKTKLKSVAQ